jgi:trk system potassium uptake protein TrkH
VLFVLLVSAGMALYLILQGTHDTGAAFTQAAFNVVSVVSTTGYATADYSQWGVFPLVAFMFLIFVGGSTGSTSGGIKIMRFQIMASAIRQQVRRIMYPHIVQPVRFSGRPVTEDQVTSVGVFIFVYLSLVVVGALLLAATGLDFVTALSGSAQAAGNVGPGLGPIIGPSGTFASLGDFQKLVLAVMMILGRLEILSVLVLFAPSFYR